MRFSILLCVALMAASSSQAQTVDEILNHSQVVGEKENLFLKLEGNVLKIGVGKGNSSDAQKLTVFDKTHPYFLSKGNALNIFIRPVNPLNHLINAEITFKADEIEGKHKDAVTSILGALNNFSKASLSPEKGNSSTCSEKIASIKSDLTAITATLTQDQKENIVGIFNKFKGLPFDSQSGTKESIDKLKEGITPIEDHFNELNSKISDVKSAVAKFKCDTLALEFLFTESMKSIISTIEAEQKVQVGRLTALKNAVALVEKAYADGAKSYDNMLTWYVPLGEVNFQDEKITDFTLNLNKGGFETANGSDITATKTEKIEAYTLSFKKFNHWVPEVAAGVAYSDIPFQKYGTSTDAAGNTILAESGKEKISKFSLTTMLNYNYFIANSFIHPFVQVGVGTSTDYQALFLGVGGRLTQGLRRLAISFGGASPFEKRLDKLKVGDTIKGTSDIDADLTNHISWFKKIYFGVQIKI